MKTEKIQFCIDHVECPHLSIHAPPSLSSMPPPFPSLAVSLPTQSRARICTNNTNKTKVKVKMRAENTVTKSRFPPTHYIRAPAAIFLAWNRGG